MFVFVRSVSSIVSPNSPSLSGLLYTHISVHARIHNICMYMKIYMRTHRGCAACQPRPAGFFAPNGSRFLHDSRVKHSHARTHLRHSYISCTRYLPFFRRIRMSTTRSFFPHAQPRQQVCLPVEASCPDRLLNGSPRCFTSPQTKEQEAPEMACATLSQVQTGVCVCVCVCVCVFCVHVCVYARMHARAPTHTHIFT